MGKRKKNEPQQSQKGDTEASPPTPDAVIPQSTDSTLTTNSPAATTTSVPSTSTATMESPKSLQANEKDNVGKTETPLLLSNIEQPKAGPQVLGKDVGNIASTSETIPGSNPLSGKETINVAQKASVKPEQHSGGSQLTGKPQTQSVSSGSLQNIPSVDLKTVDLQSKDSLAKITTQDVQAIPETSHSTSSPQASPNLLQTQTVKQKTDDAKTQSGTQQTSLLQGTGPASNTITANPELLKEKASSTDVQKKEVPKLPIEKENQKESIPDKNVSDSKTDLKPEKQNLAKDKVEKKKITSQGENPAQTPEKSTPVKQSHTVVVQPDGSVVNIKPDISKKKNENQRPQTPTQRPQTPTQKQQTGQQRPQMSQRPQTPTQRPQTPTQRPQTPTQRPQTPTQRPQTPTQRPQTLIQSPQTLISQPLTPAQGPQTPTPQSPPTPTSKPQTSTPTGENVITSTDKTATENKTPSKSLPQPPPPAAKPDASAQPQASKPIAIKTKSENESSGKTVVSLQEQNILSGLSLNKDKNETTTVSETSQKATGKETPSLTKKEAPLREEKVLPSPNLENKISNDNKTVQKGPGNQAPIAKPQTSIENLSPTENKPSPSPKESVPSPSTEKPNKQNSKVENKNSVTQIAAQPSGKKTDAPSGDVAQNKNKTMAPMKEVTVEKSSTENKLGLQAKEENKTDSSPEAPLLQKGENKKTDEKKPSETPLQPQNKKNNNVDQKQNVKLNPNKSAESETPKSKGESQPSQAKKSNPKEKGMSTKPTDNNEKENITSTDEKVKPSKPLGVTETPAGVKQEPLQTGKKPADLLGDAKTEISSISQKQTTEETPASVISDSKKSKNKKSKQTEATPQTKTSGPKGQQKIPDNEKKSDNSGAKPKEKTDILGLVQEVSTAIGKQKAELSDQKTVDKGIEQNEPTNQNNAEPKDETTPTKSKKSRNRRKAKAKEGSESQGQDNKATGQGEQQVKTTKKTSVNKESSSKSQATPQGNKGTATKNKPTSQSKPVQPPVSDINNQTLNDLTEEQGDLGNEQDSSKVKKKRKHRRSKAKQTTNEDENEQGVDKENEGTVQSSNNNKEKDKNSSKNQQTSKSTGTKSNEKNKKQQSKPTKTDDKQEATKQQKVTGTLSEEQLTHLTRTAVNLRQSLGETEKTDLKFTPDIMRSLLAPKPTDIASSAEDEGELEYRLVQRQIFLPYVCHVCKSLQNNNSNLKKCNSCKLISYCSKKHQKDHWSAHKDMCTAITNICKRDNLSHLFQKAVGLTPNEYRCYRNKYVNMCSEELGRNLQLWEKEMIYYPQVCHTCYEYDSLKLNACTNCGHVNFCNANHRKADHDVWCKEFQIYRNITLHQFHNGMIRPVMPEKIFKEFVPLTGNMENFLSKTFGITEKSVHMSKLHFVTLTDLATCPFTVLFALENCGFALKDAKSLIIHLVGAEIYFEVDNIKKWELLLLHLIPSLINVKIVFVGPELNVDAAFIKSISETKVCPECNTAGRKIVYEFWPGLYHDYMASEKLETPNLICAFNAGLYRPFDFDNKDTWSPTIEAIFKSLDVPVVVTEYTEEELPLDIAKMKSINPSVTNIIPPTKNPFSSSKPSLNFLSEENVPVIFKNFYITIVKRSKI